MSKLVKIIDDMIYFNKNTDVSKEKINYNLQKITEIDGDISYRINDEGFIVLTITKNGKSIENVFDWIPQEVFVAIDKATAIRKKKISKNEAKTKIKTKYRVGDIVVLRGKIKDGSEKLVKKFEVRKVIWSIKGNPVNILILKQLEGNNNNISLDKNDCIKYHIKYEPGLQAYSMMLNFSKITKKQLKY